MSEQQAEAKPNGSVPQTVTVEVPDGLSDEDKQRIRREVVAAMLSAGSRFVLENDSPPVATAGALLRQDAAGWPSTIMLPSPAGPPVRVAMTISGSVAVAQAVRELATEFGQRIGSFLKARAEAGEAERVGRVAERDQINAWYAEALFDAGVVVGWDEAANDLPFNRENFVALAARGAYGDDMVTPFLSGVLYRFRQVTQPLLEALDSEGEASRAAQTGMRGAEASSGAN